MSTTKVVVHGITGKMGREVLAAVSRTPGMEVVGGVSRRSQQGSLPLPSGSGAIPVSSNLGELLRQTRPNVLVDFTNAEACMAAVPVAAGQGVHLVIGTSGLSEANLQEIDRTARENGVGAIVAPNFALGAVLMLHLAKVAAPFFDYVDIIEMHHETKIDAPSGTALATAKLITQGRQYKRNVPQKETLPGTRGGEYNGVTIHSVRLPGRMAHQNIIFGAAGQTLTISHDAISRECYMPGVIRAIQEVVKFKGLVVGLDKVLGL